MLGFSNKKNKDDIDIKAIEEKIKEQIKEDDISSKQIENEDDLYAIADNLIDLYIQKKPTYINSVDRGLIPKEELKKEIYEYLDANIKDIKKEHKEFILKTFETHIWGFGKYQKLIDDPDISDIKGLAFDNTRIKVKNERINSDVKFRNKEEFTSFVNRIANRNEAMLSDTNAILRISDDSHPDFKLRINISTNYINSVENPYIHFRKIPKKKVTLEKLVELKMLSEEMLNYFKTAMNSDVSFLFVGKGGSGKTTLMNALLERIPHNRSGLVIQETDELFSNSHPDLMFQRVRLSRGEGKINYSLKDLSINGLVADIDYFVIGEIKGGEAYYFSNAAYTDHVVMASLHASSAKEGPDKMVDYMKYESDLKKSELLKMLSHIDVVCFMKDFKCFELTEIAGYDEKNERLVYNDRFKYEIKGDKGNFVSVNDSCQKIKEKIKYGEFKRKNAS